MANKFHRLATQGELHRPERTGVGNPNRLTLDFLEDGQYYQDVTTGAVYRFNIPYGDTNTANGSWELLIAYDRSLGSITNIGASLTGSIVGITTGEISSDSATDFVSSIPAYMYTQLREGEDIRVIDSSNISNYASFTINSDVNAGIVNVEVQEMYLSTPLPAQSSITVEGAIYTAYNSMDPTKIQLGVERRDLGDSIGTLSANITNGTTGVTTIELKDIDPTVNIEDNQKLILKNRAGNYDILTANGAQNLESSTGTVTVDSFIPVYDYLVDQAFLYEPSYGSSSRLTLTSNSITLLTEQVSNVSNSVAGLNLYVQNNFASATLFAEFQDNTNTSISQLELNATAQQSSLELLSSFQSNASNAIASINATTNALGASVNTSVQYNNVGAYIELLAGVNGSAITLQADQINVDGVVTFINDSATTTIDGDRITTGSITAAQIDVSNLFAEDITIDSAGTIESSNFVRGSSGFIIEGNGNAEFNEVTIRNGIIVDSIDGGSFSEGFGGIEIVDSLPPSGEEGQVVFLTTDSKLYRWTGSEWTASVPTLDLVGDITTTQISNDSISTPKLQANSINADKIQSNAVTANKIAAGSIVADKIAVGAVTAAKIGASQVTADKIAAGAVTAVKINAGAVTTDKIDAGAVTATKLNVTDLNAVSTNTGALSVTGELTMGGSGIITNSTDDFQVDNNGFRVNTGSAFLESGAYTLYRGGVIKGSLSSLTVLGENRIQLDSLDGYNLYLTGGTGKLQLSGSRIDMYEDFELRNFSTENGMRFGLGDDDDFYMAPLNSGTPDFTREFRWDRAAVEWRFDDDLYVGGTFSNPSDQRYKENIEPLQNSLDNLMSLQTVKYDMKDFLPNDDRRMIGVFAQEVEQFYPEAVSNGSITDEDGNDLPLKSVSYTQLVPILIHAIQELKQQLDDRTGTT